MDKIRITKDENGAVILRFEKREECEKYMVYFRRENGRFKFLLLIISHTHIYTLAKDR